MQDLRLWQLLHQKEIATEEVLPLLGLLAALAPEERLGFFGALPRSLEHPDPAVRAATAGVLAGAGGVPTFRHLVALLHDPEPAVRASALEALRASAGAEPYRWVHALFHPLAEVRRAALDPSRPSPLAPWYALYLLPDPECADLAQLRLEEQPLPPALLPLLFDFLTRELLTRVQGRRLIAAMPGLGWLLPLSTGPIRTPAEVERLLGAALVANTEEEVPFACGSDALDDLCSLFFDPEAETEGSAAQPAPAARFFDSLGKHLVGLAPEIRLRLIASLVLTGARRSTWPTGAAALCAVFWPAFLRCAWVPREVRYQAVHGLYAFGQRCPRRPDEEVRELVQSPLCRRPSGGLDLWVVGGVLHLVAKAPYKLLQEWVGLEKIFDAFQEDMEYALPFLGLTDHSERGSRFLIARFLRARSPGALLPALLTFASPADRLGFLTAGSPGDAVAIFLEIRRLSLYRGLALSQSKEQKAAELLGDRVAVAGLEPFLKAWLALPAPEETELGLLILARAARKAPSAKLLLAALGLDLPLLKKLLIVVAWSAGFPYEKEKELARALRGHGDAEVRAWAEDRLPPGSVPEGAAPAPPKKARRLRREAAQAITTCAEADLPAALASSLAEPVLGLCPALARRPAPSSPRLDVCAALLASHDPPAEVAHQLARFGVTDPGFVERVDKMMVRTWRGQRGLGLVGHAWLYRWEEHCYAFGALLGELPAG